LGGRHTPPVKGDLGRQGADKTRETTIQEKRNDNHGRPRVNLSSLNPLGFDFEEGSVPGESAMIVEKEKKEGQQHHPIHQRCPAEAKSHRREWRQPGWMEKNGGKTPEQPGRAEKDAKQAESKREKEK